MMTTLPLRAGDEVYFYVTPTIKLETNELHLLLESAKSKGKKKRGVQKDVAKDFQIPPIVLFMQSQICLAEGLTMVNMLSSYISLCFSILHIFEENL